MTIYFFSENLAAMLLDGWVLYQLFIKKRKWADMQDDAGMVVFFVIVWIVISYFFLSENNECQPADGSLKYLAFGFRLQITVVFAQLLPKQHSCTTFLAEV